MKKTVFSAIGIERLRVFCDGEGITTLVAGYGCPLRCRYCLNPQCFAWEKPQATYDVAQLIEEVAVDDLYFQATGGGVVFGGGEPLLQADFIHMFRRSCPSQWKIYLESSLSVPRKELEKAVDDIDRFLIDIKDMDPAIYRKYTEKENTEMLSNLQLLAKEPYRDKVTIRLPLIPGYNTSASQEQSREILEKMGFCSFDLFLYDEDHALNKRRKTKEKRL